MGIQGASSDTTTLYPDINKIKENSNGLQQLHIDDDVLLMRLHNGMSLQNLVLCPPYARCMVVNYPRP